MTTFPDASHWGILDYRSWPLRTVRTIQAYRTLSHPRGTHSYTLTLACGHMARRKGSIPIPARVRCRDCYADGLTP